MTPENRRAPRSPLIASAELVDVQTGARLKARTSDVSTVGCYLDTMTTLPEGTEVRLKISHNEAMVNVLGIVANSLANMGMGISFTEVSLEDQKTVETWLAAVACGSIFFLTDFFLRESAMTLPGRQSDTSNTQVASSAADRSIRRSPS